MWQKASAGGGGGNVDVEIDRYNLGGGGSVTNITWQGNSNLTIPTTKKARGFIGDIHSLNRYVWVSAEDGLVWDTDKLWKQSGVQVTATFSDNSIVINGAYTTSGNYDVTPFIIY